MNTAQTILSTNDVQGAAIFVATKCAINIDQDWVLEATIYTFEDGSVLVSSGPALNAYANKTLFLGNEYGRFQ